MTPPPTPPLWRQALYAVVAVALALGLAEAVLALAGVRPASVAEDPYLGFAGHRPLFVEETQPDGRAAMVTAANKLGFFNRQSFAREKPANGYRIFCMGGSTTYGHPNDDATSFCGWLRAFLTAADPSRTWEVVNAGGISYASYRVAALMEELARHKPDLFIVYSGHNEFIEERSYRELAKVPDAVLEANAALGSSRVYTAVRAAVTGPRGDKPMLQAEVSEILARTVGPTSYRRDDALRAGVVAHYRFNLARMVALARAAGSDVRFVMPASNLKDMAPFKSEHREGLGEADRARWAALTERAKAADSPAARLAALDEALGIDGRHAETHFLRGRAQLELGRGGAAREAFLRALDEDIVPLRMLPAMADDLRAVAAATGVPLVDFAGMIDEATRRETGHPIPGREWFVDHVHLTVEGYRVLGLELLRGLVERGVARPGPHWDAAAVAQVSERVRATIDARAQGTALMNVAIVIGWAGRFEEAHDLLRQARAGLGDDLALLLRLGHSAERLGWRGEAEAHYREAAERHPGDAEPHRRLADLARAAGDREARFRHLEEVVRRAPDEPGLRIELAEALAGRERFEDAEAHYRALVRLLPEDAVIRANRGVVLLALGRADEAHAEFAKAQALDPGLLDPYLGLGQIAEERGDLRGAEGRYAEAVRRHPGDAAARLSLGGLLARSGRLDAAIEQFAKAVEAAPDSAEAHFNLGMALRERGRGREAARHLEQARRLSGGALR